MKHSLILLSLFFSLYSFAQDEDTSVTNKVVIYQDYQGFNILAKKETDINIAILKAEAKIGKGFS